MINYEMALSEIEMYKKAHESLSENLTHANKKPQQFKAERDKFEQMINEECERGYQMEGKYRDMKAERDTLIDDLSWYKAKVSRLEQRISKLVSENTRLQNELFSEQLIQDEADDKIKKLERENEKYDKQFTDYIDETNVYLNLLSEISQHIGNKPSSSTYKYFRGKLNALEIRECEDDER